MNSNQGDNLTIHVSPIYHKIRNSKAKIVVLRGGTRSTKTYSMCQAFAVESFEIEKADFLISMHTLPMMKGSVYKDFVDFLENNCICGGTFIKRIDKVPQCSCGNPRAIKTLFTWHKTDRVITNKQTGSRIFFHPTDNEDNAKKKYYKSYFDECDAIPWLSIYQIIFRSEGQIYLGFNPSDEYCWINTEIEQKRDDFELIKSSYKDNPFLPDVVIKEIEYMKELNPNYYHVYGLGEYGHVQNKVYNNVNFISDQEYDNIRHADVFYGLDFGEAHPTALIEIKYYQEQIYLKELVYEAYLGYPELAKKMRELRVSTSANIFIDHRPYALRLLRDEGWASTRNAKKSVSDGIKLCQTFKLNITKSSSNLTKEINKYVFEVDAHGRIKNDTPVKFDDHAMDAMRYGIYSYLYRGKGSVGVS